MNKVLILWLISFGFFYSFEAVGQRGHGSLYSTYGLGLPSYDNFGMAKRLGGTGAAVRSPYFLNSVNPASQTGIQTGYSFLVDVDVSYNYQVINTDGASISNNFSNLNYFSFWFRLSPRFSASMGLSPLVVKDFSFSDNVYFEGLSEKYTRTFRGWGNLNKAYLNFAASFGKRLSVGVRPYYLFGNNTEEATYLNANDDGFISKNQTSLYGVGADLGFQLLLMQKKDYALVFGATANMNSKINGNTTGLIHTYIDDELLYEADEDSETYELGPSIRGGLSFQNKSWVISTDFLYALKSPDVEESADNQVFSLGAEVLPDYYSTSFRKRMNYSFGASYQTGSLALDGYKVPVYSAGAAVGVPINASSRVSLGYTYKRTGTENVISRESLHAITLNFTFGDRWFQKYKYD